MNALPLLLVGGAALLIMGRKKKSTATATAEQPAEQPAEAPAPLPGLAPGEHTVGASKNYQLAAEPGAKRRALEIYKDGKPSDVFVTASPFIEKTSPGHYELPSMTDNIVIRFLAPGTYEVSLFGSEIDARWIFQVQLLDPKG